MLKSNLDLFKVFKCRVKEESYPIDQNAFADGVPHATHKKRLSHWECAHQRTQWQ